MKSFNTTALSDATDTVDECSGMYFLGYAAIEEYEGDIKPHHLTRRFSTFQEILGR